MRSVDVPEPLRQRLGDPGTRALLDVLEQAGREGRADVLTAAADRFERRLAEECGSLRVEMAGLRADLRQEMAGLRADLRQEMAQQLAAVQDMAAGFTGIHKWAFLFWTGQLLVVMALFGLLVGMGR